MQTEIVKRLPRVAITSPQVAVFQQVPVDFKSSCVHLFLAGLQLLELLLKIESLFRVSVVVVLSHA